MVQSLAAISWIFRVSEWRCYFWFGHCTYVWWGYTGGLAEGEYRLSLRIFFKQKKTYFIYYNAIETLTTHKIAEEKWTNCWILIVRIKCGWFCSSLFFFIFFSLLLSISHSFASFVLAHAQFGISRDLRLLVIISCSFHSFFFSLQFVLPIFTLSI